MCKPQPINRWYWRCTGCLAVVAVETELTTKWVNNVAANPQCSICGEDCECMGRVSGGHLVHDRTRCACDARCTSATGPNCDCSCGGVNHGTGAVVPYEVNAGGIPVIQVPDTAKRLQIVLEWRAAIEPLVRERNALAAERRLGRIPQDKYNRWWTLGRVIQHARGLRTHSGRMKYLEKYTAVSV